MDEQSPQPRDQAAPARPKWPLSRIILLIILAIALVGLGTDLRARTSSNSAYEKVNEAYGQEGHTKPVPVENVHEWIGEPDSGSDARTETYTWCGGLSKYILTIHYNPDAKVTVRDLDSKKYWLWEEPAPEAQPGRPTGQPGISESPSEDGK